MSLITVRETLIQLLMNNGQWQEGMKPREIIEKGRTLFFDFDFPIWTDDPKYSELYGDFRPKFETLFLKHFYRYHLCYDWEEYDEWNLDMDATLNLIMPYYNHILESETWFDKYIVNPANNTDYKEEYTRNIDSENNTESESNSVTNSENETNVETESNSETSGNAKAKSSGSTESETNSENEGSGESGNETKNSESDLPKNGIDYTMDYASSLSTGNVKSVSSSTGTTHSESSEETVSESNTTSEEETNTTDTTSSTGNAKTTGATTGTTSGTVATEETYTFRRVGNIGVQTPGEVFEKTRKAFINTMEMIFKDKEVTKLFLQVYGIGEEL